MLYTIQCTEYWCTNFLFKIFFLLPPPPLPLHPTLPPLLPSIPLPSLSPLYLSVAITHPWPCRWAGWGGCAQLECVQPGLARAPGYPGRQAGGGGGNSHQFGGEIQAGARHPRSAASSRLVCSLRFLTHSSRNWCDPLWTLVPTVLGGNFRDKEVVVYVVTVNVTGWKLPDT